MGLSSQNFRRALETNRRKFNLLIGGAIAWHALPGKSFAPPAEGQAGNSAPVARGNTEFAAGGRSGLHPSRRQQTLSTPEHAVDIALRIKRTH